MPSYEEKKRRLVEQMRGATGTVALDKDTSNLFRDREGNTAKKLNVRDFHDVLSINPTERWVEVEGMTPYNTLVDALLPHGFMPAVVPQLKSITIGGAVVGVGIEATSFRYGLVHETIMEMEVLLPGGTVVSCTPHNEHSELFHAMPNSYGTLGYILKLKAKIIPVKKYVHVHHRKFTDAKTFFTALSNACTGDADFVDGVVFSRDELILSLGRFVDDAPATSDYTYRNIYYRSLQRKSDDFLTTHDYLWRWDTDWFWCSKTFGAQHPLLRPLFGRTHLNSVTYTKIMRWSARTGLGDRLERLRRSHGEAVIQDICIPLQNAEAFLAFLFREIKILPIWICPTRAQDATTRYPLFPVRQNELMIDFGFWETIRTREKHPEGFFNRIIERETERLGGLKSLYSRSFFSRQDFDRIYNGAAYRVLKKQYDPEHRLRDLYEKCVQAV